LSFALSAHLLVVTSYNLVQLSAEELVEKSPFEELKDKELEEKMSFVFCSAQPKTAQIDFLISSQKPFCETEFEGFQREIPPPPPDRGLLFS
jgi:hypothetical protein